MSAASHSGSVRVSVIIKALNEEAHIGAAIASALAAVATVGGEVILADSGSTDETVNIAKGHAIRIVQLKNRAERRCGIGPQLGYQLARGEFIYILDGDMELDPLFLGAALAAMDANPRLGGVGGVVEEESEASYQFRGRKRRGAESVARSCEWLDMGGLYRTAALREIGYFSNRNLHAYEEMELGLRLGAARWSLQRLPVRGVLHHGWTEGSWALLMRRWKSRYLDGAGELLRASTGRPYFFRAARTVRHLFVALVLWLGLIGGVILLPVTPWLLLGTVLCMAVLVAARMRHTRSVVDACFGQVVWQITALAMVRGYLTRPRNPIEPIEHVVIAP